MSGETKDPIERPAELQPGDTLAERYTVLQLLGRGATSVVYQAKDTLANEIVALKVIRQFTPGSDRALESFRRELAVARRLAHPNVIRIYDMGTDGRIFYIVMEYIDGMTLAEQLAERGRMDIPQFFRFFHQFAEALRWIHQRNIVHRDVKPSNVMITRGGVLKLTDFGIAKELGGVDSTTRIGTPGYAPPEQIFGRKLTASSDIYSAGAMFFELLTGSRPLAKRTLADQCTKPPPSLAPERPDAPAALCQVVEKCLQPDPANRFQTVDELVAAMAAAEGADAPSGSVRCRLSDVIRESPADLQTAIPLMLRIVNRVREIHESSLVHDQLTPRNIFVLASGAVEIDAFPPPTSSGATLVSEPKYVSPEAFAEGVFAGQQSSVAGDIYVLGFVFYEMLAGSREFGKQFAQFRHGQNDIEWLRWHADLAKKLPGLRQFCPDCPRQLESLLESMLAKAPENRLKSLDQVAASVKEVSSSLQETRVEAPPTVDAGSKNITPAGGGPTPEPAKLKGGLRPDSKVIVAALVLVTLIAMAVAWVRPLLMHHAPAPPASTTVKPVPVTPTPTPSPSTEQPKTLQTATGAMMLVPKDEYRLGDNAQPVTLGPFYIDKYEVTNGLYNKFCGQPGHTCPAPPALDADYNNKLLRPVIGVSWTDADNYCKSAGKRLPTDAEWEAAARGTDQRKYPWGNWMVPGLANLGGGSSEGAHTADVGSYPVDLSPSGVADMAGNAREWVAGDSTESGKKFVRGGSFDFPADQFSLTWKGSRLPGPDPANTWPVGFRCSADADAAKKLR